MGSRLFCRSLFVSVAIGFGLLYNVFITNPGKVVFYE